MKCIQCGIAEIDWEHSDDQHCIGALQVERAQLTKLLAESEARVAGLQAALMPVAAECEKSFRAATSGAPFSFALTLDHIQACINALADPGAAGMAVVERAKREGALAFADDLDGESFALDANARAFIRERASAIRGGVKSQDSEVAREPESIGRK